MQRKKQKDKPIRISSEKEAKEFVEWENSVDGVLYELNTWEVPKFKYEDKVIIAEVLLKLPKRIRRKVLDEAIFVLSPEVGGSVYNACFTKLVKGKDLKKKGDDYEIEIWQPLIFLTFNRRLKKSDKMDITAHEIAHFILGHGSVKSYGKINPEKQAKDLAVRWGFNRIRKSYRLK